MEPTPYSVRSVRRESDMRECGNTIGYPGTQGAFGVKRSRPL